MPRKKKKRSRPGSEPGTHREPLSRSLAPLLKEKGLRTPPASLPKVTAPAPAPARRDWRDGVLPLEAPLRVRRAARAGPESPGPRRLAGTPAFVVDRSQPGQVTGYREDLTPRALRPLSSPALRPHATLDLHGVRVRGLERELNAALRGLRRDGPTLLLLVHGKGLHSPGRLGVLGDAVLGALTEGPSARLVRAFRTAPPHLGGEGALLVELEGDRRTPPSPPARLRGN